MTLTDAQIDRYSRQIVVPHIGGRGQERLLAARMLLAGDPRDIEAPLAYLAGAGIGTICLKAAGIMMAEMHDRNPDVTVTDQLKAPNLALLIVGSETARKTTEVVANDRNALTLVIARLDAPGKIEIIPDALVAQTMGATFGARSEFADFVAMLATAEAFKLLAGYSERPSHSIIEFDGYETVTRVHP